MMKKDKLYVLIKLIMISCTIILGLLSMITFVRHFRKPETIDNTGFEDHESIGRLENFQI